MQIFTISVNLLDNQRKKEDERERKNVEYTHTRIKYLHKDESSKKKDFFSFPEIKLHFEIVFAMKYDFLMRLFPFH